jgi:hypothetical protein
LTGYGVLNHQLGLTVNGEHDEVAVDSPEKKCFDTDFPFRSVTALTTAREQPGWEGPR